MKSEWTVEIKVAPRAAVCVGVCCVFAVLSCVIYSYLFAECKWKEQTVQTRKWINRRRAWCLGNSFKRTS